MFVVSTTFGEVTASISSPWSTSTARAFRPLLRRIGRLPGDKALETAHQKRRSVGTREKILHASLLSRHLFRVEPKNGADEICNQLVNSAAA